MIGGSFEGGYAHGWSDTTAKKSQFFIDDLNMKFNVNVSDKIKVVIDEHFAASQNGAALNSFNSQSANFNNLTLGSGDFQMSAQSAYVEHKCSDHMTTQFGYVRTPFGMENMWSRYDSHSYYYSTGFANQHANGFDADMGIKTTYTGMGNLEVALLGGQKGTGSFDNMPAASARWSTDMKAGGITIMPVASTYLGRWRGGPLDVGTSAGANMKMGMFAANLEYMYGSINSNDTDAGKTKVHTVWVEPMVDLGVVNVSAKVDYHSDKVAAADSTSDWNVSGAVTHEWDKLRIRAAYSARNLKNTATNHNAHDFRIMFGTKF
ncbi:MAG: porin [Proteobacteria bacterium]|nr:porin [Pseudomonadota bacterium]